MSQGYKSLNIFFSNNKFIGSYLEYDKIPIFDKPEVCFLGRSNVGKSSLINKITKNKKLAKTSKTPGRTQSINFFSINDKVIFADLPGYGFSKFPETLKKKLYYLMKNYIEKRDFLKYVFLLIDGKIGIKESDIETISFFVQKEISFAVILTKIDKVKAQAKNSFDTEKSKEMAKKFGISNYVAYRKKIGTPVRMDPSIKIILNAFCGSFV